MLASYNEWLAGNNADFVTVEPTYIDNMTEIRGQVGAPTEHILQQKEGSLSREFYFSPEAFTSFLARALGTVATTGSADPWTHTVSFPLPCTINPPSFSFIELLNCAGFTATFYKYKGATVESIAVELSDKGFIKLTVNIKTDGSETAEPTLTVPTSALVTRKLLGNMAVLKYGPLGTETLTGIRNVKFTISLGLVIPPSISTATTVEEYQYGEGKPSLDGVEFTIKGDKSHVIYSYHIAKTACILNLLIDAGVSPARSVQLICSQTICKASVKPQGSEHQLTVSVMPESNATDGSAANPRPARFICKTGVAAYLVGA